MDNNIGELEELSYEVYNSLLQGDIDAITNDNRIIVFNLSDKINKNQKAASDILLKYCSTKKIIKLCDCINMVVERNDKLFSTSQDRLLGLKNCNPVLIVFNTLVEYLVVDLKPKSKETALVVDTLTNLMGLLHERDDKADIRASQDNLSELLGLISSLCITNSRNDLLSDNLHSCNLYLPGSIKGRLIKLDLRQLINGHINMMTLLRSLDSELCNHFIRFSLEVPIQLLFTYAVINEGNKKYTVEDDYSADNIVDLIGYYILSVTHPQFCFETIGPVLIQSIFTNPEYTMYRLSNNSQAVLLSVLQLIISHDTTEKYIKALISNNYPYISTLLAELINRAELSIPFLSMIIIACDIGVLDRFKGIMQHGNIIEVDSIVSYLLIRTTAVILYDSSLILNMRPFLQCELNTPPNLNETVHKLYDQIFKIYLSQDTNYNFQPHFKRKKYDIDHVNKYNYTLPPRPIYSKSMKLLDFMIELSTIANIYFLRELTASTNRSKINNNSSMEISTIIDLYINTLAQSVHLLVSATHNPDSAQLIKLIETTLIGLVIVNNYCLSHDLALYRQNHRSLDQIIESLLTKLHAIGKTIYSDAVVNALHGLFLDTYGYMVPKMIANELIESVFFKDSGKSSAKCIISFLPQLINIDSQVLNLSWMPDIQLFESRKHSINHVDDTAILKLVNVIFLLIPHISQDTSLKTANYIILSLYKKCILPNTDSLLVETMIKTFYEKIIAVVSSNDNIDIEINNVNCILNLIDNLVVNLTESFIPIYQLATATRIVSYFTSTYLNLKRECLIKTKNNIEHVVEKNTYNEKKQINLKLLDAWKRSCVIYVRYLTNRSMEIAKDNMEERMELDKLVKIFLADQIQFINGVTLMDAMVASVQLDQQLQAGNKGALAIIPFIIDTEFMLQESMKDSELYLFFLLFTIDPTLSENHQQTLYKFLVSLLIPLIPHLDNDVKLFFMYYIKKILNKKIGLVSVDSSQLRQDLVYGMEIFCTLVYNLESKQQGLSIATMYHYLNSKNLQLLAVLQHFLTLMGVLNKPFFSNSANIMMQLGQFAVDSINRRDYFLHNLSFFTNIPYLPLLHSFLPYIIPIAIKTRDQGVIEVLNKTLTINNIFSSKTELILKNLTPIMSFIITKLDQRDQERSLLFMNQQLGDRLSTIDFITFDKNNLIIELIQDIKMGKQSLIKLGSMLKLHHQQDLGAYKTINDDSNKQAVMFLKDHILAVLFHFDKVLVKCKSSDNEQERACAGLFNLLNLVDENGLDPYKNKLLGILKKLTASSTHLSIALSCWEIVIKKLSVPTLGLCLPEIVYTLLFVYSNIENRSIDKAADNNMRKIESIFHDLFYERKAVLKSYYEDLLFAPYPEINSIRNGLEKAIMGPFYELTIKQRLALLCEKGRGLNHENVYVRINALMLLSKILTAHDFQVIDYVSTDDQLDEVIKVVFISLLKSICDIDEINSLVVPCLVAIGPIDPVKFDSLYFRAENSTNYADQFGNAEQIEQSILINVKSDTLYNISNMSYFFAMNAINKFVVPAYIACTNTISQDKAAYALQELAIYCGFSYLARLPPPQYSSASPNTNSISNVSALSTPTHPINKDLMVDNSASINEIFPWLENERINSLLMIKKLYLSEISTTASEVLHPFLLSEYSIALPASSDVFPIFTMKMLFNEWIFKFTKTLILKLESEKAKKLFHCFLWVIETDVPTTKYILSHLVLHHILYEPDTMSQSIFAEIITIISQSSTSMSKFETYKHRQLLDILDSVFNIINQLQNWLHRVLADKANRDKPISTPQHDHYYYYVDEHVNVINFLNRVSKYDLSLCSYNAGIYTQALMQFESHIHETRVALLGSTGSERVENSMDFSILKKTVPMDESSTHVKSKLDFLSKVYLELGSSDGLAGVDVLRDEFSLEAEAINHEIAGRYPAALSCYGELIAMRPNTINYHKGLLECYYNISDYDNIIGHINKIECQYPHLEKKLNAYGIQANLMLGNWKSLETSIKLHHEDEIFGLNIAKFMNLTIHAKPNKLIYFAKHARNQQLAPLISIFNNISDNYSINRASLVERSFEHIFNLSMVEKVVPLMQQIIELESMHNPGNEITMDISNFLSNWDVMYKLLPYNLKAKNNAIMTRHAVINLLEARGILLKEEGLYNRLKAETWLEMAKVARKNGEYQLAYKAQLKLATYMPQAIITDIQNIERAKLFTLQGYQHHAIQTLKQVLINANINFEIDTTLPSTLSIASHTTFKLDQTKHKINDGLLEVFEEHKLKVISKALLLLGNRLEEKEQTYSDKILQIYKNAVQIRPDWERGYFALAKYFDKKMERCSLNNNNNGNNYADLKCILENYSNSLLYGSEYVYQSLPRLISLWLDYGYHIIHQNKIHANSNGKRNSLLYKDIMEDKTAEFNIIINELLLKLPLYYFLIVFSQILSRLCHPHLEVYSQLEKIVLSLINGYPQQSLWQFIYLTKSTNSLKQQRSIAIIDKVCQSNSLKKKGLSTLSSSDNTLKNNNYNSNNNVIINSDKDHKTIIKQMSTFKDFLVGISNKSVDPKTREFSLDTHFRPLTRMAPMDVILPLQASLNPLLPTMGFIKQNLRNRGNNISHQQQHFSFEQHLPFSSGDLPMVFKFVDKVEVLSSLQRPKKLSIIGSNGLLYGFLCKPKDDLRKDARVMEFLTMINKLLSKDPASIRRKLRIRTYGVTILSENCGMLEWVKNTDGYRSILQKLYKSKGLFTGSDALRKPYKGLVREQLLDPKIMVPIFTSYLLPRHPSVFVEWFFDQFPNHQHWYSATLAYSRSLSVMSIVGYILGLGDRHGENILLDAKTAEILHVDFSILFGKGKTLEIPEKVPFRLTRNMVDALGVCGVEGLFRKNCETTLSIMKKEADSLKSILTPFIYDPVSDWTAPSSSKASKLKSPASSTINQSPDELQNPKALVILHEIDQILKGNIRHMNSNNTNNINDSMEYHLSTEGHINHLIMESTSIPALATMYVGWSAFL